MTAVRQLTADRRSDGGESGHDPRDPFQLVSLGLIALLFGVSAEHGINRWYAMMEPSLARHLSRLGGDFERIGPPVDHRGKRYPMTARVAELAESVAVRNPALAGLIDEIRDSVVTQAVQASTENPALHPSWVASADPHRRAPLVDTHPRAPFSRQGFYRGP